MFVAGVTVTRHEFDVIPLAVVAFITARPSVRPVRMPLLSMVATVSLFISHVTVVSAFSGVSTYSTFSFCPTLTDTLLGISIFVGSGATASVTVSSQKASRPLSVVTVINVMPFFTPVTTPSLSTFAMVSSSLNQVSSAVAFSGVNCGVSFRVLPMATVAISGREMDVGVRDSSTIFLNLLQPFAPWYFAFVPMGT